MELIVVVALIGIMLVFSVPRVQDTVFSNASRKTANWLMMTVKELKEKAATEQKRHVLHVNLDTNALWLSNETMEEDAVLEAEEKGYVLPDGVRLQAVEYPGREAVTDGQADITFFPQGYSDKALIHVESETHGAMTFLIEPFLSDVIVYDTHAGFND